jgi:hypothetical protein
MHLRGGDVVNDGLQPGAVPLKGACRASLGRAQTSKLRDKVAERPSIWQDGRVMRAVALQAASRVQREVVGRRGEVR